MRIGGLRRMASAIAALLAAGVPIGAQQPTSPAGGVGASSPALAFTNVTVIDVTNGRLRSKQTVVIQGNRIRAIGTTGNTRVPAGARVVDAQGKYVMPGLWDMHAHVDGDASRLYPLFIAHGVTGIREMAQRFPNGADSFRVWQHDVMAGARVGPRSWGPSADMSYLMQEEYVSLTTDAEIRSVVDSLKTLGMVFLKIHDGEMSRERFFAIAREARRVNVPFVGHVFTSKVTNVEASDSGIASIEHIQQNLECWPDWPAPLPDSATVDARCGPIAKAYVRNGTWVTPTLATHWLDPTPHRRSQRLFSDILRFMRMLHRMGVRRFLAGTDWAYPFQQDWELEFRPGLSAAEELVFLTQAGLTPLEAVQAATLNPAVFFHATDSLGTVTTGKLADLVLLDGNPLSNIDNVLRVRGVVANGRYFDRAALDSLDRDGTQPGSGLIALQRRSEQQQHAGAASKEQSDSQGALPSKR